MQAMQHCICKKTSKESSESPKCAGNQRSAANSGRLLRNVCLLQEVLQEQMADVVPVVSNTLLFQPILAPCKAGVSRTLLNPLGKLKGMEASGLAAASSTLMGPAGLKAVGLLEAPEICKLSRSRQRGVTAVGSMAYGPVLSPGVHVASLASPTSSIVHIVLVVIKPKPSTTST